MGVSFGAEGHFLNMTRCTVSVDTQSRQVTVDLKIDFTRILGDPVAHYELTRMDLEQSASERIRLIAAIQNGLLFYAGQTVLQMENTYFEFPDLPLGEFTEPWAAPMSQLRFEASLPPDSTGLMVTSKSGLLIEYPLVVSMSLEGESQSSITRWLEPGQKSPVLEFEWVSLQNPEANSVAVSSPEPLTGVLGRYTLLGYAHILPKGLDHILFVFGLFFLSMRWKPLLLQVSLFTLAHTLTLVMVSLGTIPYRPDIVEPLIALSIAYVGIENLRKSDVNPLRLVIVFLFGLVHGMGFAGMLGTLELPVNEFVAAVVAFNFGVELGQLSIIAVLTLVCFKLTSWKHYGRGIRMPVNVGISLVASVWFIQRLSLF